MENICFNMSQDGGLKRVQIETTNLCNSKCVFCVHRKIKKFGTMSDKLYEKILHDCTEISSIDNIIPMQTGEPLMDKKIIQRLKMINEILPWRSITLYTNISLLNSKLIQDLSGIENLKMSFSLNGATRKTRKALMGFDDYDHAVKMIREWESRGKPFSVSFITNPMVKMSEMEKFRKIWGCHAILIGNSNFIGEKQTGKIIGNMGGLNGCGRAKHMMNVLWDGRVCLCCFDAFGNHIFGDLNKQSVWEVWNSKERQKYMNDGMDLDPCKKCTIVLGV